MIRSKHNPLITAHDINPSHDFLKVDGVFNCGVTQFNGEIMMLLRVAESAKSKAGVLNIPLIEKEKLVLKSFDLSDRNYDFNDTRTVRDLNGKTLYLTSLSHFRRARSKDGIHFEIDEKPFIFPQGEMESWGIEDPRITYIENRYLINYTAASKHGVAVGLIETRDFITYERKGLFLPVDNKDVSIFPEKIGGKYFCYHRPVPRDIGSPNMWIASSNDLIHWGNHELLLSVSEKNQAWDNGRIGGGAPSIKTESGWLHIYHAATKDNVYSLGAFLTPLDEPSRIIAKTIHPILSPEADYEKEGFFGQVVFTCGAYMKDDVIYVYYGAADDKIALATIGKNDLLNQLTKI